MRALALLTLMAVMAACGPPPLNDAHSSADELARAVLAAIARNDAAALKMLAVNEQEFRAHIWPSLAAARPERNLPFSYVWGDLRQKSDASLARIVAEHGGRRYELVSMTFAATPTEYAAFRVHGEPRLTVRPSNGSVEELRITGSFLEKDGAWKVFSYLTDD